MALLSRRRRTLRRVVVVTLVLIGIFFTVSTAISDKAVVQYRFKSGRPYRYARSSYDWSKRRQTYPVANDFVRPPTDTRTPQALPRIQHKFDGKSPLAQDARRREILDAFTSCWNLYRDHAWGHDELKPISLASVDGYGGWGATLIDSLDALWIMDLKHEFARALHHVGQIDWNDVGEREDISLFETNIRYLGGLLSAYDLSKEKVLLLKAIELGDMLYNGFDTPLRMPANSFNFEEAKAGQLEAKRQELVAHVGSLSLEFTRLAQLTRDPKYFDAIERIKLKLVETQMETKIPGLWPVKVDLQNGFGVPSGDFFTMGAMADSTYEYLPKMHMLLGGLDPSYEGMYLNATTTAKETLLFRPMLPDRSVDILLAGSAWSGGITLNKDGDKVSLDSDIVARGEHLGCFAGGMFALGARLFPSSSATTKDMAIAGQLTRGCIWAYEIMPSHVMPEEFELIPCKEPNLGHCAWDEDLWMVYGNERLPKGFRSVHSKEYFLRPEAVESLFYMWRTTGEEMWRDAAWDMFVAIRKLTATAEGAFSAVKDVTKGGDPLLLDQMESFWLAETLKYFYLIFSEPDLISLDDYVLNTEAHPFLIPKLPMTYEL